MFDDPLRRLLKLRSTVIHRAVGDLMRAWCPLLIALALLALGPLRANAEWPERSIQIIVPFPPGGAVDGIARQFGQAAAVELGQPIVVINRDGASGMIGSKALATSAPNGYTMGIFPNGPLTIQPSLSANVSYRLKDFTPVCQLSTYTFALIVKKDGPYPTLKALLGAARQTSAPLSYGFGGVGTAPHFAMLGLIDATKTKWTGIPYRGAPLSASGVLSGTVDAAVVPLDIANRAVFKILAVFSDARAVALPDIPTAREEGVDVTADTLVGLFVPAATPTSVTVKLGSVCAKIAASSAFKAALIQMNQSTNYLVGASFEKALQMDEVSMRKLIESSGIKDQ
jgi:tripartite-type tricarboxylate transporter receptor subunit TctC